MKRLFVISALFMGLGVQGLSVPTSLNLMPIADILAHRNAYWAAGGYGTERNISTKITGYNALQIGLFDVLEFGYDNDYEGETVYNIKVGLADTDTWGLSIGYMGLRKHESQSYAVARYTLSDRIRLHAGWLEDGKSRSMFGLDLALNDNWSVLIDGVSGRDSMTYVGLFGLFPSWPGFDLTVSLGIPHERSTGYVWGAIVGYTSRF